jgi:hypothetical protein
MFFQCSPARRLAVLELPIHLGSDWIDIPAAQGTDLHIGLAAAHTLHRDSAVVAFDRKEMHRPADTVVVDEEGLAADHNVAARADIETAAVESVAHPIRAMVGVVEAAAAAAAAAVVRRTEEEAPFAADSGAAVEAAQEVVVVAETVVPDVAEFWMVPAHATARPY